VYDWTYFADIITAYQSYFSKTKRNEMSLLISLCIAFCAVACAITGAYTAYKAITDKEEKWYFRLAEFITAPLFFLITVFIAAFLR
jgi:hypothetical protein